VLELARFATVSDEAELISWAEHQTPARIRREADRRRRREAEETRQAERTRSVRWWFEDGTFELQASLPAAQGATVATALERVAEQIPQMPGEEGAVGIEQRRADALVALCSGRLSADPDPDRATVVIHADLKDLKDGGAGFEIEGGGVAAHATLSRLLCDGRVETIVSDGARVVAVAAARRTPPAWMVREVRRRDDTCGFPGCDARRYTQVHHLRFWSQGGATTVEDQALICGFHHRLLHEHGWRADRVDGSLRWFWPDGRPHRRGHDPDEDERAAFARRAHAHRARRPRSPGPAPGTDAHRSVPREPAVSRT
jgi:hypothetical protein